jgi:hypothetical protein
MKEKRMAEPKAPIHNPKIVLSHDPTSRRDSKNK